MSDEIYSNEVYLDSNSNWHLEDSPWKASEISRILKKNDINWETCVEVGCGSGGIVYELAKKNPEKLFEGYDIAGDATRFWARHAVQNLKLIQEDFIKTKRTADVLLLIDVFEHVEDYMGFLRLLSSKAKWLVFHIPLDLHLQGLMRNRQISVRQKVGHLHYFSEKTALATLRDTGYQITDHFLTDVAFSANKSERAFRTRLLNPVRHILSTIAPHKTALVLGGYSLMVLCKGRL